MAKTIAIDFDGTLCTNEFPNIGKPHWGVIYAALKEKYDGSQLILWTCREGDLLDAAVKACKEWGLTFDAINESTQEWKEIFGCDPRKVGAAEYWDDRAVYVYEGAVKDRWPYEKLVDEYNRAIEENRKISEEYLARPEPDEFRYWVQSTMKMTIECAKLMEENNNLRTRLGKAEERIRTLVLKDGDTLLCTLCEYQKPCSEEECDFYEEKTIDVDGKPTFWSCWDTEWGKCEALKDTPCNGCDFEKHFKWNGE